MIPPFTLVHLAKSTCFYMNLWDFPSELGERSPKLKWEGQYLISILINTTINQYAPVTHRQGTSTILTILFACIYQESVFSMFHGDLFFFRESRINQLFQVTFVHQKDSDWYPAFFIHIVVQQILSTCKTEEQHDPPKFNSEESHWKMMVGRRSFAFGMPSFEVLCYFGGYYGHISTRTTWVS